RVQVESYLTFDPYPVAKLRILPEEVGDGLPLEALARAAKERFARLAELTPELPDELAAAIRSFDEPLQLSYLLATTVPLPTRDRQDLLEAETVTERFRRFVEHAQREIAVRELEHKITEDTQVRISETQKEFVLRERLRAIQKELGQSEETEIEEMRARLRDLPLSDEVREEAERELARLERISDVSPEHGMIRSWLEWIVELPWKKTTGEPIDLKKAREILDEDHHDLDKVKERLIDHLAAKKLRAERGVEAPDAREGGRRFRGEPLLCFVGPPGTGKTSLGQSIARALGREFVRMSLGGIHDESEIRGHRRTYIGAMPGRIVQALRRAKVSDPVFMLDEIDKLGVGFHGDPSAALLEVLDPAQNHAFVDTYLGVPVDLSQVLFICTANTTDTIPPALLDRMEVIRIPGYTDEEKLAIATHHLIPQELRSHGLSPKELRIERSALRRILREYTREAGVRNLDREIATIVRKVARKIGEGVPTPIRVGPEDLHDYLGPRRFFDEVAERIDRPGVVTGLAWTPTGGQILFVEAALMPARRDELILTGMLGEVMRESAQAALSLVRSTARRLGLEPRSLLGKAVHLHVPVGATPKDGPSAGLAMYLALVSLVTGRIARQDVAVTGEITLRGKVLPVGGIRDKVLAAHRAGIRTVVLPRNNEPNLEDVTAEVRDAMRFAFVDEVEEAVDHVLEP
ncbi:MAG TPA: endopeptidase La, partial [Fredinandcohnia sp.]|nr:endopeptidase La [Fredinandcohnia sp.]